MPTELEQRVKKWIVESVGDEARVRWAHHMPAATSSRCRTTAPESWTGATTAEGVTATRTQSVPVVYQTPVVRITSIGCTPTPARAGKIMLGKAQVVVNPEVQIAACLRLRFVIDDLIRPHHRRHLYKGRA